MARRISIHSPRMGRDRRCRTDSGRSGYFNPLSPHGERQQGQRVTLAEGGFQSTLPAWGETHFPGGNAGSGTDFNPLSPHGERRSLARSERKACDFNPLSPHGERRLVMRFMATDEEFQSTLPAWGETSMDALRAPMAGISIHSPRMGRDFCPCFCPLSHRNFNPLSPHGERRADRRRARNQP